MIKRGKRLALFRGVAVSVLALSVFFAFGSARTLAAGNPEISFEGKVVNSNGTNITDASYNMEFIIYTGCTNEPTNSTGCTPVWTEDHLVSGTPVAFTSGTFQVNLGSLCGFTPGTCQGYTNTGVSWDTSPLYLSMQIGNTSATGCTAPLGVGNFQTDCGGDGAMNPFIELTATPYAEDAGELGGLAATAFGQLANTSAETWSGNTNKFQPATLNVPSLLVDQNNSGSFGQDIFDVQGSSGGTNNFIQVTSTAANAGAVNISALGGTTVGNNVTLTAGTATGANQGGNIVLNGGTASATTGSSGGGISITGANGTTATGTGGAGGGITITSGSASGNATVAQNAGTVSIDTGVPVDGGTASITIGPNNATLTTIKGGTTFDTLNSASDTVQTNVNSQTGFQIQNAVGSPIFQVDTTSTDPSGATVNYLTYPGFEVPNGTAPQGWSSVGGAALTQNTNQQFVYNGIDSAKVAATGTGQGLSTTSFISTPPTQAYYVSFEVEPATGVSIEPSQFTVSIVGGSTQTCNPTGTTAMVTTGFTQLYCEVNATTGTPTTLEITETIAGNNTFYFDSVQMQSTTFNGVALSGPSGYQIGGIQLRGIIENPVDIEPESNSTTAFQVQNSGGSQLFYIDTLDNIVQVGSSSSNNTVVQLGLDSYNTLTDPTTCTTTTDNGALYYNSNSSNIRACINGTWQDVVSTAALSQLLFGVVPDSGNNPGDLIGASATNTTNTGGPCKVRWASTTSVSVNACQAYSGGREVNVANTTLSTAAVTASQFDNVCLNASGTPVLMGGTSGTDGDQTGANLTNTTATTLAEPLLCLATVETSATAGDVGKIYDIRTFTTSEKTYGTITAATPQVLGGLMVASTAGLVINDSSGTGAIVGVLVAATQSAGTAGKPNALYAINGPQWIKGTSGNQGDFILSTTTLGYASAGGVAGADVYDEAGINQAGTYETSCSTAAYGATDCQASLFTENIDVR